MNIGSHLLSSVIQIVFNFFGWIFKHFGVKGILIILFLIEIPIVSGVYKEITSDYKYESQYTLEAKTPLAEMSTEEADAYADIIDPDCDKNYVYQLEIHNIYYRELAYPSLHESSEDDSKESSRSCFFDHRYMDYYSDLPSNNEYMPYYNGEVVPAYATVTIPCVISAEYYYTYGNEPEGLKFILEPLTDDLTQDNRVVLDVPEDNERG